MLQQTQVQTVIPYWKRFLARFPTARALAEASASDVLAAWSGLGYYSRARNLHRAAKVIVTEHEGQLPSTIDGLRRLPGFGRYTAGAVASIAFGKSAPAVDGNVARVLSRIFLVDGPPGNKERERRLWELAEALVEGPRPGDLNQALMELGATVCRSQAPTCLLCPARANCEALRLGKISQIPPARTRPPRRKIRLAVALWHSEGRYLLARRPEKGLFGGLWELPSIELGSNGGPEEIECALRHLLGDSIRCQGLVTVLERCLTHRDLQLNTMRVIGRSKPKVIDGYQEIRWAGIKLTRTMGMSAAMSEVLTRCVRTGYQTLARPFG
jgi:A/G-specific adenine glycosylase